MKFQIYEILELQLYSHFRSKLKALTIICHILLLFFIINFKCFKIKTNYIIFLLFPPFNASHIYAVANLGSLLEVFKSNLTPPYPIPLLKDAKAVSVRKHNSPFSISFFTIIIAIYVICFPVTEIINFFYFLLQVTYTLLELILPL